MQLIILIVFVLLQLFLSLQVFAQSRLSKAAQLSHLAVGETILMPYWRHSGIVLHMPLLPFKGENNNRPRLFRPPRYPISLPPLT
jgi:hypothetical protein